MHIELIKRGFKCLVYKMKNETTGGELNIYWA